MAYVAAIDESRELWEESFFEESLQNYGYAGGAAVPAEPERPEPERPEPKQKPAPRRRIRRAPDPDRQKSKRAFVLFSVMLLCGALGVAGMYARSYDQKQQIGALSAELEQTRKETLMMQEEAGALSMTELYSYATEQLGMVSADGKTIIYISLTPQDYTVDYTPGVQKETKVSFHWFGH